MRATADHFEQKYGLPNFALGVDGTHVRLGLRPAQKDLPPGIHPQDFWSRKQFFSINCQIVGNEKKLITNLVARWAGSTHDSRIWNNSNVKNWIEQQNDFMIVGDSAYPISKTLMKPYLRPTDVKKIVFNKKVSAIRTIMTENLIGLWKRRFPALSLGIRTKLSTACDIIVATAVLHNLTILWDEPEVPEGDNEDEEEEDDGDGAGLPAQGLRQQAIRLAGQEHRDWLMNTYIR